MDFLKAVGSEGLPPCRSSHTATFASIAGIENNLAVHLLLLGDVVRVCLLLGEDEVGGMAVR